MMRAARVLSVEADTANALTHHGPRIPAYGYSHGCSDQPSPLRPIVDADTSIRIPMRRAAEHRSGKKGSPMDGHKVPSWHEGCKHVCGVHSCPHPGAAPSFIFNPAHTHYVAFGKVASMVVSCLRAPHHTCCNFIYKLLHIKVDATMLCAIAARIMRGSVDIEQHRLFAPHV
jgi:hypothetical protein